MTQSQIKVWGFSHMINNIADHITAFTLGKLIAWEIWEHDFNLTYNPVNYPIFSVLWLYFRIGKELTIKIKNGKINDIPKI